MREIKFRAWGKEDQRWLKQVYLHIDGRVNSIGVDALDVRTGDSIILNQYTGLKDGTPWEKATPEQRQGYTKKTWRGVDIYEGDIVKFRGNFTAEEKTGDKIGEVYWDADAVQFRLRVPGLSSYDILEETDEFTEKSQVIGNIYENPELLQ